MGLKRQADGTSGNQAPAPALECEDNLQPTITSSARDTQVIGVFLWCILAATVEWKQASIASRRGFETLQARGWCWWSMYVFLKNWWPQATTSNQWSTNVYKHRLSLFPMALNQDWFEFDNFMKSLFGVNCVCQFFWMANLDHWSGLQHFGQTCKTLIDVLHLGLYIYTVPGNWFADFLKQLRLVRNWLVFTEWNVQRHIDKFQRDGTNDNRPRSWVPAVQRHSFQSLNASCAAALNPNSSAGPRLFEGLLAGNCYLQPFPSLCLVLVLLQHPFLHRCAETSAREGEWDIVSK